VPSHREKQLVVDEEVLARKLGREFVPDELLPELDAGHTKDVTPRPRQNRPGRVQNPRVRTLKTVRATTRSPATAHRDASRPLSNHSITPNKNTPSRKIVLTPSKSPDLGRFIE
jgi:hypothetical protein